MQAILDFTRDDFRAVWLARSREAVKGLLPADAIHEGTSTVDVYEDESGRYFYRARINPTEPGKVYLKVCDITNGTSLSQELIRQMSEEYVGWSDDPDEKFFIGSEIGIRECKDKSYAVRLEVWFIPANGGPERKLVERVFRVKGRKE